jgi:zinc protease
MQMKFFVLLTGLFIALFPVFSQQTEIPGLFRYELENGLEVFVFENHAVPLARIQITFRCGSISQTPETAGLFHFYEHMLFKGNTTYPTKTEFKSALTRLGVATWNGGTSTEYVTYFLQCLRQK